MNTRIQLAAVFLALGLCLLPDPSSARQLDIFRSTQPFPIHFLFENRIPDLERLETEEIDAVLPNLLQAEAKMKSLEQRNLLYLVTGYLYLIKEEPERALGFLNQKIRGNFILQDFRMVFESDARILLARRALENGHPETAIENLNKAVEIYLDLHRAYPASPYHGEVPRRLAEAEKLLGDAHFTTQQYRPAWQYYRKALMREFVDNEEHQAQVHLALARTYEAEGDLEEAFDIFIYLLDNHPSDEAKNAAREFLNVRRQALAERKLPISALEERIQPSDSRTASFSKRTARKNGSNGYHNPLVREFYDAVKAEEFTRIFEAAFQVLSESPGLMEARGVIPKTNQKIFEFIDKGNAWNDDIDNVIHLYPPMELRRLAFLLWRNLYSEQAARAYEVILEEHPTEVESSHMALYFLGRIHEDLGKHDRALEFYQRLLEQYDYGDYTRSAEFKVPWVHRLQGKLDLAEQEFESILNAFDPHAPEYETDLLSAYNFVAASRYWLAQTKEALNKPEEKNVELRKLVELHPLNFYAMLARVELSMNPLSFVKEETPDPETVERQPGLGEMGRKRLKRAEKLIAIGLLEKGLDELSRVTHGRESPEFVNHLIQLFLKAGGYQRSISLSWNLSRRNNHDSVPVSLIETLFPLAFLDKARAEAEPYNLDPFLVLALMRQESAFNPNARSSANAVGLMQLIPPTARTVARSIGEPDPVPDDLKKPSLNIKLGVKYLNQLLETFQDNPIFALAAYNAGPHKVKQWIEIRSALKDLEFIESIPYNETRNYVKKVLRNYVIYKTLYDDKQNVSSWKQILSIRR